MDQEEVREILELIRNKSLSKEEFKKEISQYHESDIADAVPFMSVEEREYLSSVLTIEELGEIFTFLESPEDYIEEMEPSRAADIVETMDADDAVDILEEVDADIVQDILEEMEDESREDIELIKKFDEDEIGSKITTNFITIKKEFTIKEAMKTLISEAPENDNIQNLFVIEDDGEYYGTIKLKDLIIARDTTNLLDITKTNYPTLYAHERVEDVINEIKDIDLDIIPVLAENNTILGVITSSDIIETVGDEFNEDYAKFAGLTEDIDEDDTLGVSIKKRVPWLSLLLVLNILTTSVLSAFSDVYESVAALVLFQSLILNTGGNAGTQSLALTIRAITENKIDKNHFFRFIMKELLVGIIDGTVVGIVAFGVSYGFLAITAAFSSIVTKQLIAAAIVGFSLFVAIPISTLTGIIIPLFFKKIHVDPAVASGPLITTLSDMIGVAVYYAIASLLITGLL